MRKIMFRCWDFKNEEIIPGEALAFEHYAPLVDLLSVEGIMQYTGLKDKNGVEIYEGDVLDFSGEEKGTLIFAVTYEGAGFKRQWLNKKTVNVRGTQFEPMPWNTEKIYEVIGNIYENPELLEVKEQ